MGRPMRNMDKEHDKEKHIDLYLLLSSWNLGHLFEIFREQRITLDILKLLRDRHINQLFANLPVGDQAMFEYHLESWKGEQSIMYNNN